MIKSPRVSAQEVEDMMMPLARDLHSVYIIMMDSCLEVLARAREEEGWTEERVIAEIKKIFDEAHDHHEAERHIGA